MLSTFATFSFGAFVALFASNRVLKCVLSKGHSLLLGILTISLSVCRKLVCEAVS